jgi:hypothetical protein
MNPIAGSSLLLLALGSLTPAIGADPLPRGPLPEATETAWLDLDSELGTLAGSLLPGDAVVQANVLIRAFYNFSEDLIGGADEDSVSGMRLVDADFAFDIGNGATSARVSFDLDSSEGLLEDGWVEYRRSEFLRFKVGHLKPRVLFSSEADPELLLFHDRTFLGGSFDHWEMGLEVSGHYDWFDWFATVSNGVTGITNQHLYTMRGECSFYDSAWRPQEGARGAPRHRRVLLGASYFRESYSPGTEEADGFATDMLMTYGPWGLHWEYASLDSGWDERPIYGTGAAPIELRGGKSPFSATLSRMFGPEWEAALRVQNANDRDDTTFGGLAVRYYPFEGPLSYVTEISDTESDDIHGWIFRVGINVGSSRP